MAKSSGHGIGDPQGVPAKHAFADEAELGDRRNTGDATAQQHQPPHFSQIAPGKTAKSLIDPEITHHGSDLKFAPGFRE